MLVVKQNKIYAGQQGAMQGGILENPSKMPFRIMSQQYCQPDLLPEGHSLSGGCLPCGCPGWQTLSAAAPHIGCTD